MRTRSAAFATGACLLSAATANAQNGDVNISIENLIKSGWDIAGYTNTFDNRSSLILFRKTGENYLVQCRTGFDVTRKPPVYANCYALR